MKTYQAKTVEEALETASKELGFPQEQLIYSVEDKKRGLFSKKVVVNVFEMIDIIKYAEDYVLGITDSLGIESSVNTKLDDENNIIHITINSIHNPILIGKNGKTLQALNELVKTAVNSYFHHRFRILLDIGGYKDKKYDRLIRAARKFAFKVAKTKEEYTFEPMPADERRAIHNAVANIKHVRSESVGEGNKRQVKLVYVE